MQGRWWLLADCELGASPAFSDVHKNPRLNAGWCGEAGRRAPSGIRRYSSSDPIRVAGQDQSYLPMLSKGWLEFFHFG